MGPFPTSIPKEKLSQLSTRLAIGLANWYRLTAWLVGQSASNPEVSKLISTAQWDSYRHLWQWWTAAYQDPGSSLASVLSMVSLADDLQSLNSDEDGLRDVWNTAIHHLQLRHWPRGDLEEEMVYPPGLKSYNDNLWFHWNYEFVVILSMEEWDDVSRESSILGELRRDTAIETFRQRTAALCLLNAEEQVEEGDKVPIEPKQKDLEILSGHSRTSTVYNAPFIRACSDTRMDFGPTIEACPWLRTGQQSTDLPYYLWDVGKCEVVKTSTLDFPPQYTAVSHTWGRWIKKDIHPIRLHSVNWNIPQVTTFEVSRIPAILADIPTKTPYVWLDLVCIPQDHSDIAVQEMARQALIFRNAKYAVAWLNDIENFDTLTCVLQSLVLRLLELPLGSRDNEKRLRAIEGALQKVQGKWCGLLEHPSGEPIWDKSTLNPWFTSLWTLQEAVMRPDMWLCSRTWQVPTCGSETPLSLSGLIILLSRLPIQSRRDSPEGFELKLFSHLAGLHKFPLLSRAEVLALGNGRQCTGQRAEAVMSALGATDWYEAATTAPDGTRTPYKENPAELVLGKYPLEFVAEICAKCPGEFFDSVFNLDRGDAYAAGADMCALENRGAMLPFSKGNDDFIKNSMYLSDGPLRETSFSYHESVATWSISKSGMVKILRACILSSPEISGEKWTDEYLPAIIFPSSTIKRSRRAVEITPGYIDLHFWINCHEDEIFAVIVWALDLDHEGGAIFSGILLKKINDCVFAKVGNFRASSEEQVDLPSTSEVEWLVL